jgi:hypothetical protein
MPCEGLQVLGLLGEELKCYRMKMLVGHYPHASKKMSVFDTVVVVDETYT